MLEGAVVSALGFVRKTAAGQFAHLEMVAQALATDAFSGAGAVAAVAVL